MTNPFFVYKLIFLSKYFQDTFRQIWMLPYLSYIFYDYTMYCCMYATISYIQRITFSILEWMDANDLGLFSILLIFVHNYINIFFTFFVVAILVLYLSFILLLGFGSFTWRINISSGQIWAWSNQIGYYFITTGKKFFYYTFYFYVKSYIF